MFCPAAQQRWHLFAHRPGVKNPVKDRQSSVRMGSDSETDIASAIEDLLRQTGAEVLRPCDPGYALRQDSYFSTAASELDPAYIVQPHCASEVSKTIQILVSGGHAFALRSGGHGISLGSSNIEGGVTLDLGLLDWTRVPCGGQPEC